MAVLATAAAAGRSAARKSGRRRTARRAAEASATTGEGPRSNGTLEAEAAPVFASILSTQQDWRTAVAEIAAEAKYRLRSRKRQEWDFAVAFVRGSGPVAQVTQALDEALGTQGCLLGTTAEGLDGWQTSGKRGHAWNGEESGIMVMMMQMPESEKEAPVPFSLNKQDFPKISQEVMRCMSRIRVRGSSAPPTPRAWRRYIGYSEDLPEPKGMLLFADPLASKYTVKTILEGLDMAFPKTPKFGGVCADLPPSMARLAMCVGGRVEQIDEGIVGLILPPSIALHTVTCSGSVRVGPELRLTRASGQVVEELNDKPATEALSDIVREVGPLDKFLIERDGFFLGLEAPQQPVDPNQDKVYDDAWGGSERALSYADLAKQALGQDWLVRSIETLPSGGIIVRRDDLKSVPPRVGPSWLRCQLHVRDTRRAREEMKLMMQRYLGARMFAGNATQPLGALVCLCSSWVSSCDKEDGSEVAHAELQEIFGQNLPIARVGTNGEIAPPGVAMGDSPRWTAKQGHTASCCIVSYAPPPP